MAVTILGQPTTPNVTGTSLVYSLSGSNQTQPQYRYITDVYESGSSTRLTRLFTNKNLSGNTNIDVAPILSDYLDYDYNWKTVGEENVNLSKTFNIEFGEQYGTSLSSSVTNYTGSASSSLQVSLGNIQYPSLASYNSSTNTRTLQSSSINFNYYPYITEAYGDGTLTNNPLNLMANATTKYYNVNAGSFPSGSSGNNRIGARGAQPIGHDDYATETFYVRNSGGSGAVAVSMFLFDDNADVIWRGNIINTTGFNSASLASQDYEVGSLATIGVGIPNMAGLENDPVFSPISTPGPLSASISSSNQWNFYALEITTGNGQPRSNHFYYNEDKGPNIMLNSTITGSGLWNNSYPNNFAPIHYPTYCNNEKTRFAFINSFGAWDYYNVYMPTRRVTNIDKQFYEIGNVKLNQSVTNYNVSDRGTTQYFTDYSDQFEITTETVDSQQSQWLKELFTSPEVYIQSGSNFIPINILNTTELVSNDTARNKNFQYTITYQYSNNREPR